MSFADYLRMSPKNRIQRSIRIPYANKDEFLKAVHYFDAMDDFKDGVPRTAYQGIVTIYFQSQTIYLAPYKKIDWSGYDNTW